MAPGKSRFSHQNNRFSILGKQDSLVGRKKNSKSMKKSCEPNVKQDSRISRDICQIFDELLSRFPHLFEAIFENLDNQSLVRSREVSRTWMTCLDNQKFLLMRKIQKSVEKQFKFHKAWKTVSKYVNIGIIRQG